MQNPLGRTSLILLLSLVAVGCSGGADNEAVVDEDVLNSTLLPELPRAIAPLDRRGLLGAIDDAAGAFELNADDREAQAQLVNRQFVLRIPFGCGGAPAATGPLTIALRPDGKAMTLTASPDIGVTNLGTDSKVEAAEGFWIPRPWVSAEECPAAPIAAPVADLADGDDAMVGNAASANKPAPIKATPISALTEKTAGLVQFFTNPDGRLAPHDGKAYSAVVPVSDGVLPPGGVAFRIEGRLRPFPTGRVIRCRVAAEGLRPVCFVSIQADRVAFERNADKAVLAEWHN